LFGRKQLVAICAALHFGCDFRSAAVEVMALLFGSWGMLPRK
jgi:hypothetical protein